MSDRFWNGLRWLIVVLAVLLAVISARPRAGSWNDGSRLAAIQSVGERGSFVIDESIFVKVPDSGPRPYEADPVLLNVTGTLDKLLINGQFFSDKPPVVSLLLGSIYRLALDLGWPRAADRPDLFCWWLTFLSAGVPYLVAVAALGMVNQRLGLSAWLNTILVLGLAIATYAATYTWYVNNHVLFLGVSSLLGLPLTQRHWSYRTALTLGSLVGFSYTLDLALGPALLVAVAAYLIARRVGWWQTVLVGLGAIPWLSLHHFLNYATGGTLGPANAVPEYLSWPGSPFDAANITGSFKHSPLQLLLYSLDMLFAKKGYFTHNLPLLLFPASVYLVGRYQREWRPLLLFVAGWFLLGWVVYSAGSSNLSGGCCSIRWFVPFLAPMFWIVGLMVHHSPRYRADLLWLTVMGTVMGGLMWWVGPWTQKMVPGFWGLLGVACLGWLIIRTLDWRRGVPCRQSSESTVV